MKFIIGTALASLIPSIWFCYYYQYDPELTPGMRLVKVVLVSGVVCGAVYGVRMVRQVVL